ncbi:MAG: FecR family protein [Endomicrobiales bacterium]
MRGWSTAVACSLLLTSLVSSSLYAEIKISRLSGPVSVLVDNQWTDAARGMVLSSKNKIKTVINSRAALVVDETTRIWVGPDSEMEVSSIDQGSAFNLLLGKIRAKVKLLSGKKFKVQTPVSVASVRGTEFISSADGQLAVLEGRVEFGDPALTRTVEVGEGQVGAVDASGAPSAPRDMTPAERESIRQEWQNFEADQQGQGPEPEQPAQLASAKKDDLQEQADELRSELYAIVGQMRNDISQTRELTNEIKESDLSAGRTLRDVHGNLVRVEQHLLRPDNQTLQILNLTKRSEYNYSDRRHWGFTVPNTSRLDIMDVTLKMNMALPTDITEWPSYISSKGNDMHPEKVDVKMTNQEDTMLASGEWRLKGQPDEKGKTLSDDQLVFDSYINGWKVDPLYDTGDGQSFPDPDNDEEPTELYMWGISPEMRLTKDGEAVKFIRLYTEAYVINNDGGIMNLKNFTSTSEDPFTVLKQVAGEQIIFARNLDGSSFFARGNLDLVYTPDLVIAVAQKLATQVGELTNSGSDK